MPAAVANALAKIFLAEDRISHDHATFEYQRFEQFKRPFVLVGFRIDFCLAEHAAGFLVQRRQQMNRPTMQRQRAAQRLAIDADRLQRVTGVRQLQRLDPGVHNDLELVRIDRLQQIAKAIAGGGLSREAHPVPSGRILKMQPLRDSPITPSTAQNRTNDRR